MRFLAIMLIFTSLASCQNRKSSSVDVELQPYLVRFLEVCNLYKVDCRSTSEYSISLEEFRPTIFELIFRLFDSNVIGVCNQLTKTIRINKQWYDSTKALRVYERLENVMFHELGHCVLDKDHTNPGAFEIMAPAVLGWGYSFNYQRLMDSFFGCVSNCPIVSFEESRYFSQP